VRWRDPVCPAGPIREHRVSDPNTSQNRASGTLGTGARLPNSTSSPAAVLQTPPETSNSGYTGFDLWLHRMTVLLVVFVCAVVGVLLVIIPWRPEWTDNRLLLAYPGLRSFVTHGFVRGVCSGLGMLDIWIGFWEAVHYHER
jgi:hypothetical protein